jgi:hypothetical protein
MREVEFRTLHEIGEELGHKASVIWQWLNPEKVKAENKRRNKAKQEWAYGCCPECGGSFASANGYKDVSVCRDCETERRKRQARDRTIRFIKMREEGLLNTEIAEREGCNHWVVAKVLSTAHRYNLKAPRSPYFKAPA